jgi:peptidyl-prolyl cis-trans isomerase C
MASAFFLYILVKTEKSDGDLGEFSRGKMLKYFEDIVFKRPLLKVHGLIKTKFVYHLIKTLSPSLLFVFLLLFFFF